MDLAIVDRASNGTQLSCTVLIEGLEHAVEGLYVIAFWGGKFKALGRLGPIERHAHPSGIDISSTTVEVLGLLDDNDQPTAFRNPPSSTIIERATDGDVMVFQDIYGIGWTLRHGVHL
jgi:hypothetical protein